MSLRQGLYRAATLAVHAALVLLAWKYWPDVAAPLAMSLMKRLEEAEKELRPK